MQAFVGVSILYLEDLGFNRGYNIWSVLLVEEAGVPGENHRPFGSY
jgi:hypothetical protein